MNWSSAVSSLLSYYNLGILPSDYSGDEDFSSVEKLFLGTDFSVKTVGGFKSTLGIGVEAALLKTLDGEWLPIVMQRGQPYALAEGGALSFPMVHEKMQNIVGGVVLIKAAKSKNHIWDFYRRHKSKVIQLFLFGLLINFFGLTLPLFSSFVYDKVLGNNIHETLWALALGIFFISILDFCLRSMRAMIAERFAVVSEADIDRDVYNSLVNASAQSVPPIGRFLDRYKRVLSSRDLLSSTYLLSLVDIPFLLLFAIAIFYVGGFIVFVPLSFGLVLVFINSALYVPIFDYDRQTRVADEIKYRLLTDLLVSHEAIVGSRLRHYMGHRWRSISSDVSSTQSLMRYWRGLSMSMANSASFLSYAAVIIAGAYMVDSISLTSGGLLAVSMLSSRMMASFSSLVTVVMRYHDFKISMRDLSDILPKSLDEPHAHMPNGLKGTLVFDHVTCKLREGSPPVLDNISLRFEPGEMVGIAGAPGSGKTTLLRLAAGILHPQSGRVLLDHYPVQSMRAEDLASFVGYKPQDLCLVEGSIEYNVTAGGLDFDPQQREDVLALSGLGLVFHASSIDWTTEIGARGSSLSGGQRQIVAFARAIAQNHSLMLLDEPTNGLDAGLEAHLTKQISLMKGQSTMLISTHSRKLLSMCDRIIVVGGGHILADGPSEKILVA